MLGVVSGQHFYLSPQAVKHRPSGPSETEMMSVYLVLLDS